MGKKDERVDAYIASAPPFARPILKHLRGVVHEACPDVQETLKWRMPSFEYKGMLCGMGAFQSHAVFGFWKGKLVLGGKAGDDAMGQFGRLQSVKDLPSRAKLGSYVKKAMALNDAGVTVKRAPKPKAALKMPADLKAALAKSRKAEAHWDEFPPGAKRDYLEWVLEAKQEATRTRRIATTVEWVAAGKKRNWKYENC